jgi:parvulin-like peptidyl-prolyl isomerase
MVRHAHAASWMLGLCLIAGCMGSRSACRDAAVPDAKSVLHDDGPNLLPPMPVATTGPTRGQMPERPAVPTAPVTQTSASIGRTDPQLAVRIRAHVNGLPIMDDEIREAMVMHMGELAQMPDSRRAAAFQEMTTREIDRLIERELILQDAFTKIKEIKKPQLIEELKREAAKEADKRLKDIKKATKTTTDEEFTAFLKQQGLSAEGLRRQTERNFMMTEYIRNVIYPSIQRISLQHVRDFYEENPQLFEVPDRVKWLDIFVDASRFPDVATARQHAEKLAERARNGEDFAALVKQFDHGDSSLRSGVGIGQKRGEIQPMVAEATLFSLKAGEVGPIIDMGFGFHVVKVVERDVAGREPFDEKCQLKAKKMLGSQIAEREYNRIVADLKRTATIVVYPN